MSLVSRTLGTGYTTTGTVRVVSGISTSDMNDNDLGALIVRASLHFHADVSSRRTAEIVSPLDTGNTRFQTKYPFLADANVDKSVTAYDITVEFLKREESGRVTSAATGTLTIENATRGVFTTSNALPDGYSCVVTYDHYHRPLDLNDADLAVAYLTAHLATLRMKGPGNVSRADLTGVGGKDHGNRTSAYRAHRTKFLKEYEMILRGIRGSGGVLA